MRPGADLERQRLIAEVLQSHRKITPTEVVRKIQGLAQRLLHAPLAWVVFHDQCPVRLVIPDTTPEGWSKQTLRDLIGPVKPGKVFREGEREIRERYGSGPLLICNRLVRFIVAAPLTNGSGQVWGALFAFAFERRRFTREDQRNLEDLAAVLEEELQIWSALVDEAESSLGQAALDSPSASLFENAADLVIIQDLRGNLTVVNRGAERLTEYSKAELLSMRLQDLVTTDCREAVAQIALSQYGGANPCSSEITLRAKSGRLLDLDFRSHLLFHRGMPSGLISFGRDITALKEQILARQRAESELLHRTVELSVFGDHLIELFRLQTTEYRTERDFLTDCLRTGISMFGARAAILAQGSGEAWVIKAVEAPAEDERPAVGARLQLSFLDSLPQAGKALGYIREIPPETVPGLWEQDVAVFLLGAPVNVEGRHYGALLYVSPSRREIARDQDLASAAVMAQVIGRAIEQRNWKDEKEEASALQRETVRGLELIARQRNTEEVLRRLCLGLERLCPGRKAMIAVLREDLVGPVIGPSLPFSLGRSLQGLSLRLDELLRSLTSVLLPGEQGPEIGEQLREATADSAGWREYWRRADDAGLRLDAARAVLCTSGETRALLLVFATSSAPAAQRWLEAARAFGRLAGLALEQSEHSSQMGYMARRDSLTGLANRKRLLEYVGEALHWAGAHGGQVAVAMLELDGFRLVNDALGMEVGDQLLQRCAARIQEVAGGRGLPARVGGDEFAVAWPNVSGKEEAERRAREMLEVIRQPFLVDGNEVFLTVSVGVSVSPADGTRTSELLLNADAAVRKVKSQGRNDVLLFARSSPAGSLPASAVSHLLHKALLENEFSLSFQPQMNRAGEAEVAEVLLVWNNKQHGRIPACEFIPVAEHNGMIVPIGAWVLAEACRQAAAWQETDPKRMRVAVNVSALQFTRSDFHDCVADALERSGLEPELLELEITEGVIIRDLEETARRMARLRAMGVRIAIDDFGTGYSSLSYLRQLPVDALKMDKSFLQDLGATPAALTLVQSIISMAHKIGLKIIAEGVETEAQRDLLWQAGCDLIQGNLLSPPLDSEGVRRVLRRAKRKSMGGGAA